MIDGSMQSYGLTLDKFLSHAAKWHPNAETVSAGADGSVARIGYAALYERARAVSGALHAMGVRAGHRVATLAWNTQGHLESWYGIIGMGAVCHTLNPRLTAAQIGAMLVQSEAGILLVSPDLLPLAEAATRNVGTVRQILLLDATESDAGEADGRVAVGALEPMLAGAPADVAWGEFDENSPSGL